jgi:hypothetical protein
VRIDPVGLCESNEGALEKVADCRVDRDARTESKSFEVALAESPDARARDAPHQLTQRVLRRFRDPRLEFDKNLVCHARERWRLRILGKDGVACDQNSRYNQR